MSNYQEHSNFIFKIADRRLRNLFKPHEYGKIILPFIVFKRLDSIISDKKNEIIDLYKKWKSKTDDYNGIILNQLKINFFNISPYDLEKLTQDPQNIKANFENYLKGFSPNVTEIIENFDIDKEINKLDKNNRLFTLIEEFSEIDFSPQKVSNFEMGLIFEELLRRFSELSNETSGEHYTPRDVVRLLVSLVLTESFEKLKSTSATSIFDCCCGTGGMLSVAKEWINEKFDKKVKVFLFGQEFNPETYAVCKSDMLITDEDPENIKQGNSLDNDKFQKNKFQYMITNPPYGDDWNSSKKFIHNELSKKDNRFLGGIPRVSDGQLLFLQHLISKMDKEGSRIGIVFNGSPLYTADANGGESNIRKWIIENDLLETIVALPDKLFFNTGIPTFFWILDNKKSKKRKNKIQLINATEIHSELTKNLNKKNKEINETNQKKIIEIYKNFKENEFSKIKNNNFFGYTRICVETPKKNLSEKEKKNKKPIPDIKLRNFERVPLEEDIEKFFQNEVKPFAPDSYIDHSKNAVGYEINFKKIFYQYKQPRNSKDILEELNMLENETNELNKILKKI
tara:strand:- start:210 stop:1913 length:1704 start_codon:yes stop_codon:yes gene_type:complete